MNFREDINALRAIAVIGVLLFHFNNNWLSGGFVGVDIFFVISGFLMTSIIVTKIECDRFSLINFYVSRGKRIIPPLIVLTIILMIFGWFYLTPLDYRSLGKHAFSSILFISNYFYWLEVGYFDTAAAEKWLLHTWSLSTEWQFYIIYPLTLIFLFRFFTISTIKLILLISTVLGFLFSIYAAERWPGASYYLLPTRAWEMLLGALIFFFPLNKNFKGSIFLGCVGWGIIIAAMLFIDKNLTWPSSYTLIPTLACAMVILSAAPLAYPFSNIVIQKLGLWSYSIYLWHWPLVVLANYFEVSQVSVFILMGTSIALGYISFTFIERYEKSALGFMKSPKQYAYLFFSLLGLSLVTSFSIYYSQGFKYHYDENVLVAGLEAKNKNSYDCLSNDFYLCYIGNPENVKLIVVGDSHANAILTSVVNHINLKDYSILAITRSNCPLIAHAYSTYHADKCKKYNDLRLSYLMKNHANVPVVWVARTSAYIHGLIDPLRIVSSRDTSPSIYFNAPQLAANEDFINDVVINLHKTIHDVSLTHPIYIMQPIPEMNKNIPKNLARNFLLNRDDNLNIKYEEYLSRNAIALDILSKIAFTTKSALLNPAEYLCDDKICKAYIKNRPLYTDGDHLSEFGNEIIYPLFDNIL